MNKLHSEKPGTFVFLLLACAGLASNTWAAELPVPGVYPTIQLAVNAATNGDTVRIAAGDYEEQVIISNKTGLVLIGEAGTVLKAKPGMTRTLPSYSYTIYPLLGIYRSDVVVSGIGFDGARLGNLYPVWGLAGIYLLGGGGLITNCTFTGFCEPTHSQKTSATAVHCLNPVSVGSQPVTIRVLDGVFADSELSMFVRGDPVDKPRMLRVTANIQRNVITGLGPAPVNGFGIWIVDGVAAEVIGNIITQHSSTGSSQSSGIAAFDAAGRDPMIPLQRLNFESNTFTTNGQHLMIVGGNDSRVVNNLFVGNGPDPGDFGGLMINGTNVVVSNNNFSGMPTGMLIGAPPIGTAPLEPTVNPRLSDNWFCDVAEPIRIMPPVFGLQEQGTATNCPIAPRFQSITKPAPEESRALLRGWHGDTVTLEASTNLVDWVPVQAYLMDLPTHEFQETNTDGAAQRFYRANQQ